jgi:hypothetical protein
VWSRLGRIPLDLTETGGSGNVCNAAVRQAHPFQEKSFRGGESRAYRMQARIIFPMKGGVPPHCSTDDPTMALIHPDIFVGKRALFDRNSEHRASRFRRRGRRWYDCTRRFIDQPRATLATSKRHDGSSDSGSSTLHEAASSDDRITVSEIIQFPTSRTTPGHGGDRPLNHHLQAVNTPGCAEL